ncbi:MAG: alcohol dehydrogenase, partial [Actinobacteria bacterium]|nr:alcohol dehydrogenase [Actinomycetota bacterium]
LPALAERFDLRSLVTAYPLDQVDEALDAVTNGSVLKAVLVP